MARFCNNCEIFKQCAFRGIINPCDEWKADRKIQRLREKAREIVGHAMSLKEAQFVESAQFLETFSPKQVGWLNAIWKRVNQAA